MGAKFVSLKTPSATVNTGGTSCKVDADCTNGKGTKSVDKTALPAITDAAELAKTCCWYYEFVKAASGTTDEIAVGN